MLRYTGLLMSARINGRIFDLKIGKKYRGLGKNIPSNFGIRPTAEAVKIPIEIWDRLLVELAREFMRKETDRHTATFTENAKALIKRIPRGKVATYGQIAALAGNPLGARQVVWALNSSSRTEKLPWHRVINGQGRISLPRGGGYEMQKKLLARDGVEFPRGGKLDLGKYQWRPRTPQR